MGGGRAVLQPESRWQQLCAERAPWPLERDVCGFRISLTNSIKHKAGWAKETFTVEHVWLKRERVLFYQVEKG